MIQVKNVSFNHLRPIFKEVSFTIGEGQKVGLAGPNGAGKSTLFNLLTKVELPKEGSIITEGSVLLVPQEVKRDPILEESSTAREYLDRNYEREDKELLDILRGLELSNIELYEPPHHLSGGQKTKLAIARALLAEPDVLLLDEPTNFLDTKGKEWVMEFLSTYPKTLVLVSHDLELLDKSIDKVLVIDPLSQKIEEYKGNYTQYVKLKKERDAHFTRQIINETKHVKKMEKSLVGLMGRKSEKGVRQRVQLQKRIQRIKDALPPLPKEAKRIKISLPIPKQLSDEPIKVIGIKKSFGEKKLFENLSFTIRRGEKIALIGLNGAGKSTLIKIIVDLVKPDDGEVIRDSNLSLGYYSQEFETFDFSQTLIDLISNLGAMPQEKIRPFLAAFLFSGTKVFQTIGSLSGGEKTRLAIATLLLNNHNLLVLDEPTTYLDVLSQRVILEALKKYTGAVLIVSHTEDFIKELRPDRALLLPDCKLVNWSDELLDEVGKI